MDSCYSQNRQGHFAEQIADLQIYITSYFVDALMFDQNVIRPKMCCKTLDFLGGPHSVPRNVKEGKNKLLRNIANFYNFDTDLQSEDSAVYILTSLGTACFNSGLKELKSAATSITIPRTERFSQANLFGPETTSLIPGYQENVFI